MAPFDPRPRQPRANDARFCHRLRGFTFPRPGPICVGALVCFILFAACNRKNRVSQAPLPDAPPRGDTAPQSTDASATAKAAEATEVRQAVAEAEKSLRGGSYDEAAARLLKMRISGVQLSQKDAAAYRNALQEAYSRDRGRRQRRPSR